MESHTIFVHMEGNLLPLSYQMGKSFIAALSWHQTIASHSKKIEELQEEIRGFKEILRSKRAANRKHIEEQIQTNERLMMIAQQLMIAYFDNMKSGEIIPNVELYQYELHTADYNSLSWNDPLKEDVVTAAKIPTNALIVCEPSK